MIERTINLTISPHDGMYIPGQEAHYFECGHSAIQNIKAALDIARLGTPNKILDMACGYGRVLRAIKAVYPSAQITACDIDTRAVDFCGETFGVNRAYSDENFKLASQPDSFDLIWCGSILTHLDRSSWEMFFKSCSEMLMETGLLIFTTHGRYVTRMITEYGLHYGLQPDTARQVVEAFQETGFGYGKYQTEVNYGVSVTSPSWVVSFIETYTNLQI